MSKIKKAVLCIITGAVMLAISCSKSNEETLNTLTPTACDTANMTYTTNVKPILQANCYSCHGNGGIEGGVNLDTYANVENFAANGQLIGTITHAAGYPPMPQGGGQLSDCDINIIQDWINRGAVNN